jgi:uncharacterized membrane protein
MNNYFISKLLYLFLFIPLINLEAGVEYNLVKILPPSGYDSCHVVGMNENGFVIGQLTSSEHPKTKHAFIWSEDEGMKVLKPSWWQGLFRNQQINVTDINDKNEIVGYVYLESLTYEWYPQAFIWDESRGIHLLDIYPESPWSRANGINNEGQVVGVYKLPPWQSIEDRAFGFNWSEDKGMKDLNSYEFISGDANWDPEWNLIPTAIDEKGSVFGYIFKNNSVEENVFKLDNKTIKIGHGLGITKKCNNNGIFIFSDRRSKIAGFSYFYANGGFEVEKLAGKETFCSDINDDKVVVGYAYTKGTNKTHAFICDDKSTPWREPKKTTDLNSMIMCSDIDNFSSANAINNKGQIAGDADYQGIEIGFLISPKTKK